MSNEDITNYQAEGTNVRNCIGLMCNGGVWCSCANALGGVTIIIYKTDGNNQYK